MEAGDLEWLVEKIEGLEDDRLDEEEDDVEGEEDDD
jgi:hypothetical protein